MYVDRYMCRDVSGNNCDSSNGFSLGDSMESCDLLRHSAKGS